MCVGGGGGVDDVTFPRRGMVINCSLILNKVWKI